MSNNIIYPRTTRETMAGWVYLPRLRFGLSLIDREMLHRVKGYSLDAFLAMIQVRRRPLAGGAPRRCIFREGMRTIE